ncbi:MAG: hypothetical protein AAFU79_20350 [Myxococcota bacterium]
MTGAASFFAPSSIAEIQSELRSLPDHVRTLDLLYFRRVERARPSSWETLAQACPPFVRAITELRPEGPRFLMPAVCLLGAPALMPYSDARFDTLTSAQLTALQAHAARLDPEAPSADDPARAQLAALLEERLMDLVLEVAFALRRTRRLPRRRPTENPLIECLRLRSGLTDRARGALGELAERVGPVPSSAQESFVKSARGANTA